MKTSQNKFRSLFRALRIFQTEETTQHSTLSFKKTIGTFSNKIQRIRFAFSEYNKKKNPRGAGGSSLSTIIIRLLKSSGAAAVGQSSANFSRAEVAAPRRVGR